MEFNELNLKKFFPNNLINMKNKILRTWDNIDKYLSDLDLEKLVIKVNNRQIITYKDFSAIIYNIKKIEGIIGIENNSLGVFLSLIKIEEIEEIEESWDSVDLFEDIYEVFIMYYKNSEIEKSLNILINNHINIVDFNSKKIEIYKEYTIQNLDFYRFLFINTIKNGLLKNKWEEQLNYYSISEEREIVSDFIKEIFSVIIDYIKYDIKNVNIVLCRLLNQISYEEKIRCFRIILDYYYQLDDVQKYSDEWMKKILETLGHPEKKADNWREFSKTQSDVMKLWLVKNRLEEIFTVDVNDERRLNFWKNYIGYIKKVEFYKDASQAIAMETENHLFVEFGEKGNAFYLYELQELNIRHLEQQERIGLSKLKDKNSALLSLIHSGNWERRFIYELEYLGYAWKGKRNGHNR